MWRAIFRGQCLFDGRKMAQRRGFEPPRDCSHRISSPAPWAGLSYLCMVCLRLKVARAGHGAPESRFRLCAEGWLLCNRPHSVNALRVSAKGCGAGLATSAYSEIAAIWLNVNSLLFLSDNIYRKDEEGSENYSTLN